MKALSEYLSAGEHIKGIPISVVLGLCILLLPPSLSARSNFSHVSTKPGAYSPQTDTLDNFEGGVKGGLGLGRLFDRNSWARRDVRHITTGRGESFGEQEIYMASAGQRKGELDVSPINLTLSGIFPIDKWEFFGFRGFAAYFVWADMKPRLTANGSFLGGTPEDSGKILGTHFGLGLHYDITPKIFFGVEGTCLWTSDAKFENTLLGVPPENELRMSGMLAAGILGIRF